MYSPRTPSFFHFNPCHFLITQMCTMTIDNIDDDDPKSSASIHAVSFPSLYETENTRWPNDALLMTLVHFAQNHVSLDAIFLIPQFPQPGPFPLV